jgi:hypothetical protein
LLIFISLLKPWSSMSSVHWVDSRHCHLATPIRRRRQWPRRETHLLRLHHERAIATRSQPHACRRCRNSPVTRLHVAADDAPCRRLGHGRGTPHGDGLRTLAITSLPPATQLTGSIFPRYNTHMYGGEEHAEGWHRTHLCLLSYSQLHTVTN